VRVSIIPQPNELTAAFLKRNEEAPEKQFTTKSLIMEDKINGDLPFSTYDLKCMLHEENYLNSAWSTSGYSLQAMNEALQNKPLHARRRETLAKKAESDERAAAERAPDAAPPGTTPQSITSLAKKLGLPEARVHAAVHSGSTPRLAKEEVAVLQHLMSQEDPTTMEDKIAMLLTAMLAGGATENELMGLLTSVEFVGDREIRAEVVSMQDDIRREADSRLNRSSYVPGPTGTTDGERAARATELAEPYAQRPLMQRALMRTARVYTQHDAWEALASDAAVSDALAQKDLEPFELGLTAYEDGASGDADNKHVALQRRRYCGQENLRSVVSQMASFDLNKLGGDGGTAPSWGEARAHLLQHCSGSGLADFSADKVLLEFLQGHIVTGLREDAETVLGPGALTTVFTVWQLWSGAEFTSSYKMKPSEQPLKDMRRLDMNRLLERLRELMHGAQEAYWRVRLHQCPCLQRVKRTMDALLHVARPHMEYESILCEVGRRRASALAYAAGRIRAPPKAFMHRVSRLGPSDKLEGMNPRRALASREVLTLHNGLICMRRLVDIVQELSQ
jgi:hypothetical protein